jgi:hypothetical protein
LIKRIVKRATVSAAVATVGVVGFVGVGQASASTPYTVQPGDTLSGIAGSNWRAVADANGIANPNLIFVGDVIYLDGAAPSASSSSDSDYSEPAPAPEPVAAPASSGGGTVWDSLAQCESGGDWSINTGNGYYGGLQFSQSSWNAAGGSGNPANASREEQIRVAENLLDMQGWGAWPSCSSQLGLR